MEAGPKLLLADERLDGALTDYIALMRSERKSWRRISIALNVATGVDIHPETIRLWYMGQEKSA